MKSFRFDVGARGRKASRFISRVRNELLKAVAEEKEVSGLTQQKLATKLGVNRSVINRQLNGEANLTLRSIADLAWALDRDITFAISKTGKDKKQNYFTDTTTQPQNTNTVVRSTASQGKGSSRVVSSISQESL